MKTLNSRETHGLTLIELMVTLAIIAVLAGVVIPSYTAYSTRGKVSSGTAQLASLRLALEQNLQQFGSYKADPTDDTTTVNNCAGFASVTDPMFDLSCNAATHTSFLITASNKAGQGMGDAGDYQYTIDQDGNKKTTFYGGSDLDPDLDCWKLGSGSC